MNNKDRFILYENNDEFNYKKNKTLNIRFNRVAFIFFSFFYHFSNLFKFI